MQAWFVIEDVFEPGQPPSVCGWRKTQDLALQDAKALAEAHHDQVYMLVPVEEGQDPLECITPDVLCVWHPGRVFDSGSVTGGSLLVESNAEREARQARRPALPSI